MDKAEEGDNELQVLINDWLISNLRFADDIDLTQKSCNSSYQQMNSLYEAGCQAGLNVNVAKTKTMVLGSTKIERHVRLEGWDIENVEEFVYLESLLSQDNDSSKYINHPIGKVQGC